ncbi:MAG: 50S ribosomal protein L22 [Candidatus Micrarchaeota archaeon]|nr:50S ribosomal protein L22 [Candidatus Micrarchaeota archaeon]
MKYSVNIGRDSLALAQGYDIDASYKDLCAVCDAIRYLKTDRALDVIDGVVSMQRPILFNAFNKHMGSRHELGGRKGAYPVKAAKEVRHVLINAIANSRNKGLDEDSLYVVHASANKTRIERRSPSKGSLTWGRGMYGMSARTHSDLEYSKIELGLANPGTASLTSRMKLMMKVRNPVRQQKTKPLAKPKAEKKAEAKAEVQAKK